MTETNLASATPVEFPGLRWIRQGLTYVFSVVTRYATLERCVTALECALKKQFRGTRPYCGGSGMRKTGHGLLKEIQGQLWRTDVWTCQDCKRTEERLEYV